VIELQTIAWPVAHMAGGGGWHTEDAITALLVLFAVIGLMVVASGRRARLRAARDPRARPGGGGRPTTDLGAAGARPRRTHDPRWG
jgi:hypothetical protein